MACMKNTMKKQMANKVRKSLEELNTLNTPHLLAFYKAERKRFHSSNYTCDCCHDFIHEQDRIDFDEHLKYLNSIKKLLNTREHVKRRNK